MLSSQFLINIWLQLMMGRVSLALVEERQPIPLILLRPTYTDSQKSTFQSTLPPHFRPSGSSPRKTTVLQLLTGSSPSCLHSASASCQFAWHSDPRLHPSTRAAITAQHSTPLRE